MGDRIIDCSKQNDSSYGCKVVDEDEGKVIAQMNMRKTEDGEIVSDDFKCPLDGDECDDIADFAREHIQRRYGA